MESMTQSLQEAISRNLPEAVGSELKKRLQQAENDARKARELEDKNKAKGEEILRLQAELKRHQDITARERGLADQEGKLAAAQTEAAVKKAVAEEASRWADKTVNAMQAVVNAVFANSRLKYSESYNKAHVNAPPPGQYGSYATTTPYTESKTVEAEQP